jgi:hypothetical protein
MDIASTSFWSSEFEYNPKTRTLVQEISTLSQGGSKQVFSRVYDDACDEGFKIVSKVTAHAVVYVVDGHDTNADNEIQGWRLVPTQDSVRRVPACKGTHVLVIND